MEPSKIIHVKENRFERLLKINQDLVLISLFIQRHLLGNSLKKINGTKLY